MAVWFKGIGEIDGSVDLKDGGDAQGRGESSGGGLRMQVNDGEGVCAHVRQQGSAILPLFATATAPHRR